jgi:hypothetical protein
MSADGKKAWSTLQTYDPLQHPGSCLYYCSNAYEAAGADYVGTYATAYAAAMAVPASRRHYDENPPYGAAIWLGRRHSDGNMDGDVFIAGPDSSSHAATDQPTWGQVGKTSIAGRKSLTDRDYLFWSDWIMGSDITVQSSSGGDDEVQNIYKPFKAGQTITDKETVVYINYPEHDQSVAVGKIGTVWGALYINVEPTGDVKDPAGASLNIAPYVDTVDSNLNPTKSVSLGTTEIGFTSGNWMGQVVVPPIALDSNQRLRFRATAVGVNLKVTNAVFRGAHT